MQTLPGVQALQSQAQLEQTQLFKQLIKRSTEKEHHPLVERYLLPGLPLEPLPQEQP